MKRSTILALLATVIISLAPVVRAAEDAKDKSAQTPKSERKQKQMPFRGKVSAVDKIAKTVMLEGKEKSRTFQVTSASKLTNEGKPAVMDDVAVGQTVGGLARQTAAGKLEIVTLNIGVKPGKTKDAEKKGEHR